MAELKFCWHRCEQGTDEAEVVSPNFATPLQAVIWRDQHPVFRMDPALHLVAVVPPKQKREAGDYAG